MQSPSQTFAPASVLRLRPMTAAILVCVGLYLALALRLAYPINVYCGDEGFYALAARNVASGMRPYRDFLFVQMPLLSYAYAAWFSICGTSIASGRAFSVVLTGFAIAFIMLVCNRRAGYYPAVFAGLLWSSGIYTAWDLSSIKTQALCNFLICAALLSIPASFAKAPFSWGSVPADRGRVHTGCSVFSPCST